MDSGLPITLRDYATHYRLHVRCPACDREGPLNLMRWAQLVGWNTPLETLRHALRCAECGNNVGVELRLTERLDLAGAADARLPGPWTGRG